MFSKRNKRISVNLKKKERQKENHMHSISAYVALEMKIFQFKLVGDVQKNTALKS